MKKYKYSSISEINVTSLVDVTMVLLIIFMITAPLLRSGIEVNLPKAKAEALKRDTGITISLTREGSLYLDGEPVADTEFEARLLQRYQVSGQPTVLLQADQEIPYGNVIRVIDRVKQVGITNLGLIVEAPPGE